MYLISLLPQTHRDCRNGKSEIASRLFLILAILSLLGCERVTNTITNVRLDCGSDVNWQDPYVKFVDAIGNPLPQVMLEYRSLEGESTQGLNLSSKGCLALDKPGLWLIRHREKPEGVILDFSKIRGSATLSLQDISGENLKPVCPAYEVGRKLDLRTVLENQGGHDIRGYEISFSIQSERIQKTWPKQNFSMLQGIELAGVFPEGQIKLELQIVNNFRGGEQTSKTCPVKFDYTGPTISTSLAKGRNKVYKGRPFVALSSDQDVRFTSLAEDFHAFDICNQKRLDWDVGEIKGFAPLCEKPERITAGRPVPFDSRQGFWQLYYRGVDPAGNVSDWSEPMIILLEQENARLQIVNKASKQASELNSGGYQFTPYSMLSALEIYNDWQNLPTSFEKTQMEQAILLTVQRPWMEPSVLIPMRIMPENHYATLGFPVANGKKFVSIETVYETAGIHRFEAIIVDTKTLKEEKLCEPTRPPEYWQVSKDGTKFFWFTIESVHYGKLVGEEIKFQTIDYKDEYVSAVRFVNDDAQIVVATTLKKNKLTFFDAGEQLVEVKSELAPNDVWASNVVPSIVRLTDDTRGVWMTDPDKNSLSAWSIFESDVRTPLDFDPELIPEFSIAADGLRVLDTDKHLFITYTYERFPFCSYYYYDASLPREERAKLLLEAMSCVAASSGTAIGNDVWMKGSGDVAVELYTPGSASFRKAVLSPELPAGTIDYSTDRFITESGRWMFSGSTEYNRPEVRLPTGRIRAWNKNGRNEFEIFREFWACSEMKDPREFQFDEVNLILINTCENYDSFVLVWDLSQNPPELVDKIEIGSEVTSTLLVGETLLIGTRDGDLHLYDMRGKQRPTFQRVVKLVEHPIAKLAYDANLKRLYTVETRGDKGIKAWDFENLGKLIKAVPALPREMQRTVLSEDRKYLAASSERDTWVMIWDTEDMKPIVFDENSSSVTDIALIGESPLLVSGSFRGAVKIWDFKNPDIPAITFNPGLTKSIKNIAAVPGGNEFVVETAESKMFHFKLGSMKALLNRTCEALRVYLHYMQDKYPQQSAFCKARLSAL
jgi:WD40 repeat protein